MHAACPSPPLSPVVNFFLFELAANVAILVAAVVVFLLVLHRNFLGLSDFLRRELTGPWGFVVFLSSSGNERPALPHGARPG